MDKSHFTTPHPQIDRILQQLHNVQAAGTDNWTARCPAHDDRENSLSVGIGESGKPLLKCFAGCTYEQILQALQGEVSGESPSIPSENTAHLHTAEGLTLASYSENKGLPVEFLLGLGVQEGVHKGSVCLHTPWLGLTGEELAVRLRLDLTGQRFAWKKGSKLHPYGLNRLADATREGGVILVEGESDAQTLWYAGFPALGVPGASSWKDAWSEYLKAFPLVFLVVEPDRGGETLPGKVSRTLKDKLHLTFLSGPFKGPSDLYLSGPENFVSRFKAELERALPYLKWQAEEKQPQSSEAFTRCQTPATQLDILSESYRELSDRGVSGEEIGAKLTYLILTSRLLDRPVSAVVKGPSSAGKSYLISQVLEFFPSTACLQLTAMSEKSLLYLDEPLAHRFLVMTEATGMTGEFSTYLVRSLLSEGCLHYWTVEKTPAGLRPREIDIEGPTGLLISTTAITLHPENETRLFSIPTDDSPVQTRRVLQTQARLVNRLGPGSDLTVWHDLQIWLEGCDNRWISPSGRLPWFRATTVRSRNSS